MWINRTLCRSTNEIKFFFCFFFSAHFFTDDRPSIDTVKNRVATVQDKQRYPRIKCQEKVPRRAVLRSYSHEPTISISADHSSSCSCSLHHRTFTLGPMLRLSFCYLTSCERTLLLEDVYYEISIIASLKKKEKELCKIKVQWHSNKTFPSALACASILSSTDHFMASLLQLSNRIGDKVPCTWIMRFICFITKLQC